MRSLHVGHVQLDILESLSARPMTVAEVVSEIGGLCTRSRFIAREAAQKLLERGLLSRRSGVLHLSPLGTRALSRSLAAGRAPGAPGAPRSYTQRRSA